MDDLLKKAEEFHGHLGPFLAIGVRMGLLAKQKLSAGGLDKKLRAEVHVPLKTPYSCMIDGIQIATGCTYGKRNISEVEDNRIYAVFSTDNKKIKIALSPLISLEKLKEKMENKVDEILRIPDHDLFTITEP